MKKLKNVCLLWGLSLFFVSLSAQNVVRFGASRSATANSSRIATLIRNNAGATIEFNRNTIYNFSSPIIISNDDMVFRSRSQGSNTPATLRFTGNSNEFITLGNNSTRVANNRIGITDFTFEDIIVDGNNNVNTTIINNNDSQGLTLENVTLINSEHDGISASTGDAIHGLTVSNCEFTNIDHNVIFIVNRNTLDRGARLRQLRARFVITGSTFGDGYRAAIVADCGNDFFVTGRDGDCGPNFNNVNSLCAVQGSVVPSTRRITRGDINISEGNVSITDGQNSAQRGGDGNGARRYTYSTDLRNSLVGMPGNNNGNTFGRATNWAVGLVQAANITIQNNTIQNPGNNGRVGRNRAPNSASFHIEQFSNRVRILNNTMTNNHEDSSFIDVAGNEGRRRFSDNPVIVFATGVGIIPVRSQVQSVLGVAPSALLRGALTQGCFDPITARNPPSLECRRPFHNYGPRDFTISGNTFISNTNELEDVMNFQDAERIEISNNVFRMNATNRANAIRFARGHLGNCDITVSGNRGQNASQNVGVNFDTRRGNPRMGGRTSCFNISNTSSKTIDDLILEKEFQLGPNPISNILTVSPSNNSMDYSVQLYSLSGVLIKENIGNGPININVEALASGIYIVKLDDLDGQRSISKKIVVE